MNASTKALPEGYVQSDEINLKTNKRLAIGLNIFGFFVAVASFFLLSSFAASVRPSLMNTSGRMTVGTAAVLVALVAILMTVHELVHGFFFWIFTRSKSVFALGVFYAYAGAPDWYLPARQYAIAAVGPLVIVGVLGLLLMLLMPESWMLFLLFVVAFNTGESMGDLLIFTRLFKVSPTCLTNDTGDIITFYERPSTTVHT